MLNESRYRLGTDVGNIVSAAQELSDQAKHLGARDLVRLSQGIVNQIRNVLHSHWAPEETKNLKSLQAIGIALMNSIAGKGGNLPETLENASLALQKLVSDLGVPINKLAVSDAAPPDESKKSVSAPIKDQSTPPPKPSTVDQAGPAVSPAGTGQDMASPPLGGSSGPFGAF